jgi:sulfonate transport system substrate-binding protein
MLIAALLAIIPFSFAACGDDGKDKGDASAAEAPKPTEADLKGVTLRVGVQKDGIRAVLDKTGALKDAPYKVEFSTFQFGPPLVEAAGADKIDLAWVGSTPPIFGAAAKSDFKIIAAVKERDSQENSIIVPKGSDIQTIQDLKGKKIAVPKGSSAHGLLLNALKRAGLSSGDVETAFLPPADAVTAFKAGSVDALTIWDPFTIQAIDEFGGRAITGGEPDEGGFGFEIASSKALDDPAKRAAIADYVNRLNGAWQWAGENPDGWAQAWTKESKLPLAITKKAARAKASDIVPLDEKIIARQQALADLLRDEKVLPGAVDFESILDRDVVKLRPAN